ncbi:MAG TPA: type II toxin-antitoxin system HipA family toxin [Ilumatobacteraceae bacterium]|nr:type II toxin-antitoxin system HipA family toxin [Ilumatobacteraceae bacterium]
MIHDLATFIDGRRAGTLSQDRNGRLRYTYGADYPPDATPLSPRLTVAGGDYTHADVAPFIAGLLPDNDQVLERWGRLFGVSPRNAFAILAHIGSDCAGAVQFVPADGVDQLDGGALEPLTTADIAQMLRDLRADPYTWQQPAGPQAGHFSLAGAQTKFALHRASDGWARASGRIPTTHIFKPAIPGLAHHDLNEHLCLQAARRLGLLAASSEIAWFDDERVFVVERYDRRAVNGELRRLHQVDMCQALGVMPDLKYQRDGGPGPVEIITMIRSSLAGEADVERFVQALVFNWLIGGTDAHAKNYGLVLSGTDARLAPLYDLASALVMPEWNWHKWELAMRINKQGRFKYLGIEDWKRFATSAQIDRDVIDDAIDAFAPTLVDAVTDAARPLDLGTDERSFVGHFADALAAHISRVVGR